MKSYGICRSCGEGTVYRLWGGINPWFYCDRCGIITDHGGKRNVPHISARRMKQAMDMVYDALGTVPVQAQPFMYALSKVLGTSMQISVKDLSRYGYTITHDGYLERSR